MQPALAPTLEVVVQPREVHRIDPHRLSRRHPLIGAFPGQDLEELLPRRYRAIGPERLEQARAERRSLRVLPMAAGALEAVLLPRLVEGDIHGVSRGWVV